MILRYKSRGLEKQCADERTMKRHFGRNADAIARRIKALEDAVSFEDLKRRDPLGWWEELTADLTGKWSGRASKNFRVIVQPDPADEATLQVEEVLVESVDRDYHRR